MGLPPGVLSQSTQETQKNSMQQMPFIFESDASTEGCYSASIQEDEHIGVLEWFFAMLLYRIPIINIIYVAITAFRSDGNKKNWARASTFMLIITYILEIAIILFLKNTTMAELSMMIGQ